MNRSVATRSNRVRDWMSTRVISVPPGITFGEALQVMRRHRLRRVPVVDETGRLLGMVSLGDAMHLNLYDPNVIHEEIPVEEIMDREPVTVTRETTLKRCAQLMLEHKVGALLVVEDGRLIGIITDSDIFRYMTEVVPD